MPYDALITGSDQVWNDTCAGFDPIFFLDFPAAKKTKKYSYAASFNLADIPKNKVNVYKERLKGYKTYSVREDAGRIILHKLLNVKAEINCDPTFLLSYENWCELTCKCSISSLTNKKQYILVYYVKLSRVLMEYAKKISQNKNIQVVCIPCKLSVEVLNKHQYSEYGFTFLPSASPYEFLSLFKNASYVLTNSFHGTAFSLIFRKKFYSVMDFDDGGKNMRSKNLLESVNCLDRIIDSRTHISSIDNEINWEAVEDKISEERKKAMVYLKKICGMDNNE